MIGWISNFGAAVIREVRGVGKFGLFSVQVLRKLAGARGRAVLQQIHFLGNRSLLIIAVSGLFVGFVLGLQGYYTLVSYGSEQALGVLVALSLVRELGPVVTALLFAGRAGTALTAEIGLMRSGEQIAAMEMMGVDPFKQVLAPRFWGVFVAMPVLALIFSAVGILGAWLVGVGLIGTDNGAFWSQMQSSVDIFHDIGNGILKSIVFGVVIALVALFCGWSGRPTPEGVAYSTTRTVVTSSLLVLGVDFMMTAWLFTALQSANLGSFSFGHKTYAVTAEFDNIGGLKPRAAVKSAGVVVGRVRSVEFDPETFMARVTMDLEEKYAFPADSSAKILTSGLLGEQYIGLEAGADEANLDDGSSIRRTQSAVVLENLISQFLYSTAEKSGE